MMFRIWSNYFSLNVHVDKLHYLWSSFVFLLIRDHLYILYTSNNIYKKKQRNKENWRKISSQITLNKLLLYIAVRLYFHDKDTKDVWQLISGNLVRSTRLLIYQLVVFCSINIFIRSKIIVINISMKKVRKRKNEKATDTNWSKGIEVDTNFDLRASVRYQLGGQNGLPNRSTRTFKSQKIEAEHDVFVLIVNIRVVIPK